MGKLKRLMACVYISTSIVAYWGPPNISTTPKLVKSNKKTNRLAPKIEGINKGNETSRKACQGVA